MSTLESIGPVVRTIAPIGRKDFAPEDRYVVLVRKLVPEDFVFGEVEFHEATQGGTSVWGKQRGVLHDEVYAQIDAANVMPTVPFNGLQKRAFWATTLTDQFDYRGCATEAKKAARRANAAAELRKRIEQGELMAAVVKQANYEIQELVSQHQYRFVEEQKRLLLRGVATEWFVEHANIAPFHDAISAIKAQLEPLEKALAEEERSLRNTKCEALLKYLQDAGWKNHDGDELPAEVREPVEAALKENKAYGDYDSFPRGLARGLLGSRS